MFTNKNRFQPFENKVWLASPTMHGNEMKYVTEAYETNWMSTVGANINEVEKVAAEAMGATWDGEQCGTFGDYSAISYNGACEKIGTCISCGFGISDGYKLAS